MMYFSELLRNIKQNAVLTVLTVLLLVCFILFFSYVLYYYDSDEGTVRIRENEMFMEHTIFRFGHSDPDLFTVEVDGQKHSYEPLVEGKTTEEIYEYGIILDQMITEIRANGFLDYYFGNTSAVIPFSCVNNEIDVLRGYAELGEDALVRWSQKYKDEGYIIVDAAKVDLGFIKNSNLILSEGRLLYESDYTGYQKGDPVPVILGHKFADYFGIGDIINTYKSDHGSAPAYRGDSAPYVVVGILEKDTIVFNSFVSSGTNMLENLDYTVLIPELSRDISYYDPDDIEGIAGAAYNTHFRFWNNTAFYYERSKLEYGREVMAEIINKYGFGEYYMVQNSDYNVELTEAITRKRVTGLSVMTIIVSVFTLSAIVITQLNKYNRNMKAYAIYILTGRTVKDIVLMAVLDMSLLFAASFCLSHIPLIIFLFPERYSGTRLFSIIRSVYNPDLYACLLILGTILVAACAALCYFTVRKIDVSSVIKEGE